MILPTCPPKLRSRAVSFSPFHQTHRPRMRHQRQKKALEALLCGKVHAKAKFRWSKLISAKTVQSSILVAVVWALHLFYCLGRSWIVQGVQCESNRRLKFRLQIGEIMTNMNKTFLYERNQNSVVCHYPSICSFSLALFINDCFFFDTLKQISLRLNSLLWSHSKASSTCLHWINDGWLMYIVLQSFCKTINFSDFVFMRQFNMQKRR